MLAVDAVVSILIGSRLRTTTAPAGQAAPRLRRLSSSVASIPSAVERSRRSAAGSVAGAGAPSAAASRARMSTLAMPPAGRLALSTLPIRPSKLTTVPALSARVAAGSTTSAARAVSVRKWSIATSDPTPPSSRCAQKSPNGFSNRTRAVRIRSGERARSMPASRAPTLLQSD